MPAAMQIKRFQFESFDAPVPQRGEGGAPAMMAADAHAPGAEVSPPPPPPPPSFSEEEMQAACQRAHEDGFIAGKEEGKREADHEAMVLQQQTAQIFAQLQAALPELLERQERFIAARQEELGSLVLNCAGRLALHALRKDPVSDIEAMIGECLQTLMGKPQLTVQVNPKLQLPLSRKFGKDVVVETDEALAPGDCRISWPNGEARREVDHIWAQIEEVIERYFAPLKTPLATGEQHG